MTFPTTPPVSFNVEISELKEEWVDDFEEARLFSGDAPQKLGSKDINKPKRDELVENIKRLKAKNGREEKKGQLTGLEKAITTMTSWDPYDQNEPAKWFDPEWMFGVADGFDIVIGNPPYVSIKDIPTLERRVYEKRYKFATGRFNLFYLFIERGKELAKAKGLSSFIIPDRLLLNTQCKSIRGWLLDDNNICEIVSFSDQVFEAAVVDSILLQFQCEKRSQDSIKVRRKVSQRDICKTEPINIPVFYFTISPSSQFDIEFSPIKLDIYKKIKSISVHLSDISETKDGIIQGKVEDVLFLRTKRSEKCQPLLFGENIERYSILFRDNWIDYNPEEMMSLEIQRRGQGVRPGLWMRTPCIFERPKILTRQTADKIIAAFDKENYYYANTLHGTTITDRTFHPHYLLGILNSLITTWYYRANTDEAGKVFAQIKIELLRRLPIPKANYNQQQLIIAHVDKILAAKQKDSAVDTSALECEIDALVFHLYGLTEEEMLTVLFTEQQKLF